MKTIFDHDIAKLPAYVFFAKMGKKVLRPGGIALSKKLLAGVPLRAAHVVEFAPGRGATAALVIAQEPKQYTGIEHHSDFAALLHFDNPNYKVVVGSMMVTKIPDSSVDVVIGEAFLSLQADTPKELILKEAFRVLKPGGFYVLHELALSGALTSDRQQALMAQMRSTLKVNASPLPEYDWRKLVHNTGFVIQQHIQRPMALLDRKRILEDEGFFGLLRIVGNVLTHPGALKRIRTIHKLFTLNRHSISAIGLVLQKG